MPRAITSIAFLAVAVSCSCRPRVEEPIPEDAHVRYADAVCEAYERCGCVGEGFTSVEDCRRENQATFRRVAEWSGVSFDLSCFESVLEVLQEHSCGPMPEIPCLVFSGGKPRGSECVPEWSPDFRKGHPGFLVAGQCGEGACHDGTCGSFQAPTVGIGQPCHLELGVSCGQGGYCGRDGICSSKVGPGGACDTPRACEITHYCEGLDPETDAVGVCHERSDPGGPCDLNAVESCYHPEYCASGGSCEPWPAVCFYATTPPPDFYFPADWVPISR